MLLAKPQYKVLTGFFSDVAKGLFLGSFAGQTYLVSADVSLRLAFTFVWLAATLLFLYLALICSQEANNET